MKRPRVGIHVNLFSSGNLRNEKNAHIHNNRGLINLNC
jgi:hypothetical protein